MNCEYQDQCPFHRANNKAVDPFVKKAISDYCVGGKVGCIHREAKEEYNTFLAINQTPDNTLLST